MGSRRITVDDQLDRDISQIMNVFRQKGFKNVKKPDVIRILVRDRMEQGNIDLRRKPKSGNNGWFLI